ncbi:MAG TPA: hypothetical protein PKW50_09995, partial [Syntrophomonas sp.]|nr:hypothetical protein [Syntrophomonas sp.]
MSEKLRHDPARKRKIQFTEKGPTFLGMDLTVPSVFLPVRVRDCDLIQPRTSYPCAGACTMQRNA